jgi:RHS repeat-associated protein
VGLPVWRWDNDDPYGNNAPNENPAGAGQFTCNLRLPGQYFDAELNTHYNYFRDYDPATGRYVQSDPIGLAGGINTFTYSNTDSISKTDPRGLCPWCVVGGVYGIGMNLTSQLNKNGGNWAQVDPWQVAIAGAAGAASGALGAVTSGLSVGRQIATVIVGSGVISAAQKAANNSTSNQCIDNGIGRAAIQGGIWGAIGLGAGAAAAAIATRGSANSFINTSNSMSGPFYPPWYSPNNWAAGGSVTGNAASTAVGGIQEFTQ